MNLLETVKHIGEQAVAARGARAVSIPFEPAHVYTIESNGTLEFHEARPQPRAHRIEGCDAFALACAHYKVQVIWCGFAGLTGILDDETRRDRLQFPLETTTAFQAVLDLLPQKTLAHAQLLSLVRVELKHALEATSRVVLLAALKDLDVSVAQRQRSTIERGHESMGRQIEATAAGAERIPEEIAPLLQPYRNAVRDFSGTVPIALELDLAKAAFRVVPDAEEVETLKRHALDRVEDGLSSALRKLKVDPLPQIFRGMPEPIEDETP